MDLFNELQIILASYQMLDKLPITKEEIEEIYIKHREEAKHD